MGFEQRESSSSGTAIFGAVLAAILALVALLVVGGGTLLFMRTANVQRQALAHAEAARRAEVQARMAQEVLVMERDKALQSAAQTQNTADSENTADAFVVRVAANGTLRFEDADLDAETLKSTLQDRMQTTKRASYIHVYADPLAEVRHLDPILSIGEALKLKIKLDLDESHNTGDARD